MAATRAMPPSLLIVAAFSRHEEALAWAEEQLTPDYGSVALRHQYAFDHTQYYEKEMGKGLIKRLLVFELLVASDCLPDVKRFTNFLESNLALSKQFSETRPLNLDPGLLQLGKFLLATTKDKDHRVYLRDGVFAEVTLRYEDGEYHPWPWTYADYRAPALLAFLNDARRFYKALQGDVTSR